MSDLSPIDHIKNEGLRKLLVYWLDLRNGASVPKRSQLDPIAIPWALAEIWLMQLDHDVGRFRFRLAGESVQTIFEQNLSGKTHQNLLDEEVAGIVEGKLTRVCSEPAICHEVGPIYTNTNRPGDGERLIMPLATDDGRNEFILGCTFYDWFGYVEPAGGPSVGYTTTFYPIS
ncbi:MAG: PAS domain-containing protein [Rhodospirillaceae bacterium]|nr:PAS domain-containing protein [Rhodospirillaceae bacterium]